MRSRYTVMSFICLGLVCPVCAGCGSMYSEPPDMHAIEDCGPTSSLGPCVLIMRYFVVKAGQALRDQRESQEITALTGTVVDQHALPIADVRLQIRRTRRVQDAPRRFATEEMHLDQSGVFRIPLEGAAAVYVDIHAPGYPPEQRVFVVWTRENAVHFPSDRTGIMRVCPGLATTENTLIQLAVPQQTMQAGDGQ